MLLNSQAVKGLPVICGANGKRIGIVSDVQYTPGRKRIDGIIVLDNQRFSGSIYVPLDNIITFGQAAVIVKENYMEGREAKRSMSILGRIVIRDDGQEVGTISDIVFDSTDGHVVGYEISKGFIDDLINGRNLLPENILSQTDGDVFIISVEQSDDMKSNNGGLKNILF